MSMASLPGDFWERTLARCAAPYGIAPSDFAGPQAGCRHEQDNQVAEPAGSGMPQQAT